MAPDASQKLLSFFRAVFVYLLLPFFSFVSAYIPRLRTAGRYLNKEEDEKTEFYEAEHKAVNDVFKDCDVDDYNNGVDLAEEYKDDEKSEMHLKFKFPTFEEFSRNGNKALNVDNMVPCSSDSKYEFSSNESSIGTLKDELKSSPVKEVNNHDSDMSFKSLEQIECFVDRYLDEKGNEIVVVLEEEKTEIETQFFPDKVSIASDFEIDSTSSENLNLMVNGLTDSYNDGFLSDGDFVRESETDDGNEDSECDSSLIEENLDSSEEDLDEEDDDIMEELKKLEEENLHRKPEFLSEKDFSEDLGNTNNSENIEEHTFDDASVSDSGDSNGLESLWEHQELIDQLKIELKKVRATGLPTILEESESPKIMEDLKPWKIDEKFHHHKDHIGELHKFYKSYKERMRKFDILNYQKMYSIGFLQLKDPLKSVSPQKHSAPTLRSLVSQTQWLSKHKIHGTDPMKKFIIELQGDLEVVYVGHMCLSWELLQWQYEKALDLWDSDPRGTRQYNEVAGEFQQFQVLMQRFIEDEPFQGSRVQNYVERRCAIKNLLQVPVIREDNSRDKRKAWKKDRDDEYVITSDMLVEILEESIRIFWRFVRADKDCHVATINGQKRMPELPSPEDLSLLVEVKKDLLKKDKKLKEIMRSENCVLRRFKRRNRNDDDDESDQVLYFFLQVDMKLVARVLNMSKVTRDQLIWCHNKLRRISFVNRKKIHVEPAFLLFPC